MIPQNLIETAIAELKVLGHAMKPFELETIHSATSTCYDCGLSVRVSNHDTKKPDVDYIPATCAAVRLAQKSREWIHR